MKAWHLSQHVHSGNFMYTLWTAACAFLAPIGWWLAGCAFFVLADFITGCWASRKRGEMWTSTRFRDSLSKCTAYMFMIICARILESILPSYIKGAAQVQRQSSNDYTEGAFYLEGTVTSDRASASGNYPLLKFDASKSNSIYSDSVSTVQPPAYRVNVWRRTA